MQKPSVNPRVYDGMADAVQKKLNAAGVLLLVIGGDKGDGCSVRLSNWEQRNTAIAVLQAVLDQLMGIERKELVIDRPHGPLPSTGSARVQCPCGTTFSPGVSLAFGDKMPLSCPSCGKFCGHIANI
jgi:hypothetical protein